MSGIPAEERFSQWQLAQRPKRPPRRDARTAALRDCELREGVDELLRVNPALVPFLVETGEKLREVFGEDTELAVEVFVDPESPVYSAKLFLMVKTPLDAGPAQRLLDRFDDAWWLDNAGRGEHLLQVSLEFV